MSRLHPLLLFLPLAATLIFWRASYHDSHAYNRTYPLRPRWAAHDFDVSSRAGTLTIRFMERLPRTVLKWHDSTYFDVDPAFVAIAINHTPAGTPAPPIPRARNTVWASDGVLAVRYWFLALIAALPATAAALALRRQSRRHRRVAHNQCPACGYDLRATPEAGGALLPRCPECGYAPARACRPA